MTSDTPIPEEQPGLDRSAEGRVTLAMVVEAAAGLKRLESTGEVTPDGLRAVRHRGEQHLEMVSWENERDEIVRQELFVFGLAVEFQRGQGLRTGEIPSGQGGWPDDAKPLGDVAEMSETPDLATLELVSHLLKNVKDRDSYGQHLLRLANLTLAELGSDEGATAVSNVARFPRMIAAEPTIQLDSADLEAERQARIEQRRCPTEPTELEQTKIFKPPKNSYGLVILLAAALGAAGVGLGLIVSYLLGVL